MPARDRRDLVTDPSAPYENYFSKGYGKAANSRSLWNLFISKKGPTKGLPLYGKAKSQKKADRHILFGQMMGESHHFGGASTGRIRSHAGKYSTAVGEKSDAAYKVTRLWQWNDRGFQTTYDQWDNFVKLHNEVPNLTIFSGLDATAAYMVFYMTLGTVLLTCMTGGVCTYFHRCMPHKEYWITNELDWFSYKFNPDDWRTLSFPNRLNVDYEPHIYNYNFHHWFGLLFAPRGRVMPKMSLLFFSVLIFVYMVGNSLDIIRFSLPSQVHGPMGMVLGFMLVFKTQQSHNRWWEARKAWEDIKINSMECYRLLLAHCKHDEINQRIGRYLVAFSIFAKNFLRDDCDEYNPQLEMDPKYWTEEHLREQKRKRQKVLRNYDGGWCDTKPPPLPTSTDKLSEQELAFTILKDEVDLQVLDLTEDNKLRGILILHMINRLLNVLVEQNELLPQMYRDIFPRITALNMCIGDCERVEKTPLPFVYAVHLRTLLFVYLVYLPAVIRSKGVGLIMVWFFSTVIQYMFLGLEKMSLEISNPFGYNYSDLPLGHYCKTIFQTIKLLTALEYNHREYGANNIEADIKKNLPYGVDELHKHMKITHTHDEKDEKDG